MLVENTDDQTTADPGLLRIVARAHEIQERLMQNTDLTVHAIASQERVTTGYVSRLLRLPSLAPDILTAIVNGKNPPQLTAKKLMRLAPQIPVDWAEQRKLLGFQANKTPFGSRRLARGFLSCRPRKVDPQMPPERLSCPGARN